MPRAGWWIGSHRVVGISPPIRVRRIAPRPGRSWEGVSFSRRRGALRGPCFTQGCHGAWPVSRLPRSRLNGLWSPIQTEELKNGQDTNAQTPVERAQGTDAIPEGEGPDTQGQEGRLTDIAPISPESEGGAAPSGNSMMTAEAKDGPGAALLISSDAVSRHPLFTFPAPADPHRPAGVRRSAFHGFIPRGPANHRRANPARWHPASARDFGRWVPQ